MQNNAFLCKMKFFTLMIRKTLEAGGILVAAVVTVCREKMHILDLFLATLWQCL